VSQVSGGLSNIIALVQQAKGEINALMAQVAQMKGVVAGGGGGGLTNPDFPSNAYLGSTGIVQNPNGNISTAQSWVANDMFSGLQGNSSTGLSWRKQLALAGYINAAANIIGNWVIPSGDTQARQNMQNIVGGFSNTIGTIGAIHQMGITAGLMATGAISGPAGWAMIGFMGFLQLAGWGQYMGGIEDQRMQEIKAAYQRLDYEWR
jgi:hypothetical protein